MTTASELLDAWAAELGVERELIDAAFQNVPLDFPVHVRPRLPLAAHRSGAAGITLFGRVYLLRQMLSLSPLERILILRHEAEHVRQQRADRLFYLRYGIDWLRALVDAEPGAGWRARAHRAYLGIAAEQEAYRAERRARTILDVRS